MTVLEEVGSGLEMCQAFRTLILEALRLDLPDGLYPYQIVVSDRVILITLNAAGDELIVNQCRQSGKTEAIVIAILALSVYFTKILKRHLRVGIFAPAGTQTTQVVKERLKQRYTRIRPLLRQLGLELVTGDSFYSELFVIRNAADGIDARVRCLSIGERANVTGETFHLIDIEQAEDVDPLKMTQEVFPMAAAVGGAIVLSGTPKNEIIDTYFYDAVTKREDRSSILEVRWEEAAKYNLKYKAYVLKQMERLGAGDAEKGRQSIAFQTQYDLMWRLGADKFTGLEQMRELSRRERFIMPLIDGVPVWRTDAGWDVAKENDRSIITWGVREGTRGHILEWMEFEGTDYSRQAELVAIRCVQLNTKQVCVDSAGVGDPVLDFLRKELRGIDGGLRTKIAGIPTNVPKEEDITAKLMQEVWKTGDIDYPTLEEAVQRKNRRERARFIDEFVDLNKTWKGQLMRLEAPHDEDRHDDYPKSCGLMLRSMMKPPVRLVVRELAW